MSNRLNAFINLKAWERSNLDLNPLSYGIHRPTIKCSIQWNHPVYDSDILNPLESAQGASLLIVVYFNPRDSDYSYIRNYSTKHTHTNAHTFCRLVKAVTTLVTVVRSPGENSNNIFSNLISMSCPPSILAGIRYLNVSEHGFKTWKTKRVFVRVDSCNKLEESS